MMHSVRRWRYAKLPCTKHLFFKISRSFNFQICHVCKTKSDSSMQWIISKFLVCFFTVFFFFPIYVHKYNVPWCKTERMRGKLWLVFLIQDWNTNWHKSLTSHLTQKVTCEDKTAPFVPFWTSLHKVDAARKHAWASCSPAPSTPGPSAAGPCGSKAQRCSFGRCPGTIRGSYWSSRPPEASWSRTARLRRWLNRSPACRLRVCQVTETRDISQ